MKLSEAVDLYIDTSGNLRTEASRTAMRRIARQLADYTGDRAMSSYTTDELTGFCLGHGGRGDAPNTISHRKALLSSFFAWCSWRKIVDRDPAADLRHTVKVRTRGVRTHTWLTRDEVAAVVGQFNLEDPRQHRDSVLFRTTVMLGLRRSEVASLRWESFRSDLSTVTVSRKGAKLVTKPVPAALASALAVWQASQPAGAVLFCRFRYRFDDHGRPVLVAHWDEPLAGPGVYEIIRKIASVAPHDLRRSFAGILEAQGVPLKDVQAMMDHENLATTDRYLQTSPARLATVTQGVQW